MRLAPTAIILIYLAGGLDAAVGEPARPAITVTGSAAIRVAPDRVTLRVGIQEFDADLAKAKTRTGAIMAKMIAAAKAAGVGADAIQTSAIGIEPQYDTGRVSSLSASVGYRVRRDATVILADPAAFEPLLSALLDAGANQLDGIAFETTALRKHRDAARAMALTAAREKAVAMADVLGQDVGAPIAIRESASYEYSYNSNRGNTVQNDSAAMPAADSGDATFATGLIPITAEVEVSFELVARR